MQVCVKGGTWKCGKLDDSDISSGDVDYDYCLIGEAVAPGFDFHDFKWITKEDISAKLEDEKLRELFKQFLYEKSTEVTAENKTVSETEEYYKDGDERQERKRERA